MNPGIFKTQVDEIHRILKNIDLFQDRVYNPSYPSNPAAIFKQLNYAATWSLCFNEQYFDYQLVDDSLIQFRVESYNPLSFSYVYYECPFFPTIPFSEYLKEYEGLEDWESTHHRKSDYRDYFAFASPKDIVTPVRYDFSPELYNEGLHPASHIHLGYKNNIRIGTKKILRPISFICFVIRQFYPEYWQAFCKQTDASTWVRNIRHNLDDVESRFWCEVDDWEMSLL